jgi:hypothetical protein
MTKYVAYTIEDGEYQFVSSDGEYPYATTDNPKQTTTFEGSFLINHFTKLGYKVISLEEAISLMPTDFFTNRENVTKQAAIPFAESIIKLLLQETPTSKNDRLMYNAHLQACSNQLLELIQELT